MVNLILIVSFKMQLHAQFQSYWFAPNSIIAPAIMSYCLDGVPMRGRVRVRELKGC